MFTGITAKYFSAKYRPPMIYGWAIYTEKLVLVINSFHFDNASTVHMHLSQLCCFGTLHAGMFGWNITHKHLYTLKQFWTLR